MLREIIERHLQENPNPGPDGIRVIRDAVEDAILAGRLTAREARRGLKALPEGMRTRLGGMLVLPDIEAWEPGECLVACYSHDGCTVATAPARLIGVREMRPVYEVASGEELLGPLLPESWRRPHIRLHGFPRYGSRPHARLEESGWAMWVEPVPWVVPPLDRDGERG